MNVKSQEFYVLVSKFLVEMNQLSQESQAVIPLADDENKAELVILIEALSKMMDDVKQNLEAFRKKSDGRVEDFDVKDLMLATMVKQGLHKLFRDSGSHYARIDGGVTLTGIQVSEILALSDEELLGVDGFGPGRLLELDRELARYGLYRQENSDQIWQELLGPSPKITPATS